MISTNAQIRNRQVSIVYYWDLLDDHYEEIKELVTNAKNPLELPRTVECNKLVFAICRQSVRGGCRKLRRRLFGSEENVEQGFLDWAAENKLSVVLLSDDTCGGILGEENMWQDYQIAADTAVIANSYYTPESWEGALTDPGTAMKMRCGTVRCSVQHIIVWHVIRMKLPALLCLRFYRLTRKKSKRADRNFREASRKRSAERLEDIRISSRRSLRKS